MLQLRTVVPTLWPSSSQANTLQMGSSSGCCTAYTQGRTVDAWEPRHYYPQNALLSTGPRAQIQDPLSVRSGVLMRMNRAPSLFLGYTCTPPTPLSCLPPAPPAATRPM